MWMELERRGGADSGDRPLDSRRNGVGLRLAQPEQQKVSGLPNRSETLGEYVLRDLVEARERAYDGVELVQLDGGQFRTDIGGKAARGEIKVTAPGTASAAAAAAAAKAKA